MPTTLITPPIGWRVLYLINGDPRHPVPMDVLEASRDGMIRGNVLYLGQIKATRQFIRHASDPYHETHREQMFETGSWDWLPGMEYREPSNGRPNDLSIREQIEDLLRAGKDPEQIVTAMKFKSVSKAKTLEILEELSVTA